jgi:DNA-binding transcriptional ArsR family regulator
MALYMAQSEYLIQHLDLEAEDLLSNTDRPPAVPPEEINSWLADFFDVTRRQGQYRRAQMEAMGLVERFEKDGDELLQMVSKLEAVESGEARGFPEKVSGKEWTAVRRLKEVMGEGENERVPRWVFEMWLGCAEGTSSRRTLRSKLSELEEDGLIERIGKGPVSFVEILSDEALPDGWVEDWRDNPEIVTSLLQERLGKSQD